jgi:glucuronokinase
MDFSEEKVNKLGHGDYQPMDPDLLRLDGRRGLLHLMYSDNPSDSGAVHADVRQRWDQGDPEIRRAMQELADCARKGR